MPPPLLIERVLLVAGAQDTGKSVQLRSMFVDPRFGTGGRIPDARRLAGTYSLSPFRHLHLRLTSPHERNETLEEFLNKIEDSTGGQGRWNVAAAVQIGATSSLPNLRGIVAAMDARFSPERIRVAILSPDRHGNVLASAARLMRSLRASPSCETFCIDARTRDGNGLLLADTFDFA